MAARTLAVMNVEPAWYDLAFGDDYAAVYGHRDLDEAQRDIECLVRAGLEVPFLDLGCGDGRHLLAAAERGLQGLGVDRSAAQVVRARARGLTVVQGDFRALPVASGGCAGALSLFSSFGYLDAAGDRAQLRELARVLRPRGVLFLDVADPERVRRELVPESLRQVGALRIHERRWLTEGGRRVRKEVRLERPGAPPGGWIEDLALYSAGELRALLFEVGFGAVDTWGPLSAGRLGLRARR